MPLKYQIAPNISFIDDDLFGNYDKEIVFSLLKTVDIIFSNSMELKPFSSSNCAILYNHFKANPMCCDSCNGHYIFLHVKENYWCKWLYQFSHEYCHHLINGKMSGDLKGLKWFEETICELASMYNLKMMSEVWKYSSEPLKRHFVPAFLDYLNDLQTKHPLLYEQTLHPKFLQFWDNRLKEPIYHRDLYNAIAVRIFPLFLQDPHLWKIILHFGDMENWDSLEDLFLHLRRNATPDYSDSLEKLHLLLLS